MNTERSTHLKQRENTEMRTINRKLLELAGVEDRTVEQTVQERDLEARQSWLETKNSVLKFFGLAGKEAKKVRKTVSGKLGGVMEQVTDRMDDWWTNQQRVKTEAERQNEARWIEKMKEYEALKLKEASGLEMEMSETVRRRDIENDLTVREAQKFLRESLTKAQEQLSLMSEGVEKQKASAYKYIAVLTVAASLAAACSGPDQKTVTPTGGDTGPTATLVIPPTETPTQLPPTSTETPTEIPTLTSPTETPEPTAIPEVVYRFDGIEMTETELNEWASKCSFCQVYEGGYFTGEQGHTFDMKVIFTDKYVVEDVIDLISGKVIGQNYSSIVVTRDQEGEPKIVKFPMQAEDFNRPGKNTHGGFMNYARIVLGLNPPHQPGSDDLYDFAEFTQMYAGQYVSLRFSLDDSLFEYDNERIATVMFKDSRYGEQIQEMVKTAGGSIDNNDPPTLVPHSFNPLKSDGSAMY